jgi:hypothetical protein
MLSQPTGSLRRETRNDRLIDVAAPKSRANPLIARREHRRISIMPRLSPKQPSTDSNAK